MPAEMAGGSPSDPQSQTAAPSPSYFSTHPFFASFHKNRAILRVLPPLEFEQNSGSIPAAGGEQRSLPRLPCQFNGRQGAGFSTCRITLTQRDQ